MWYQGLHFAGEVFTAASSKLQQGVRHGRHAICAPCALARKMRLLGASAGPCVVNWGSLDDVVMGGVSESGMYAQPGGGPDGEDVAVFSGTVSESNNGGFASVRTSSIWLPLLIACLAALCGIAWHVTAHGICQI